jgi:ABC-2 type transport system permease protein
VSQARLYLDAAVAVARRDTRMFLSYRGRLVGQILSVFVSLALFYYLSRLISVERFPTPEAYFGFVVVGIAILQVLTATLTTLPTAVRTELMTGTFERLVVSPFGPVAAVVSMLLFPMAFAFVLVALTMLAGATVFGLDLRWSTAPFAIPVAALGCFAFVPFSLVTAGVVLLVKQAGTGATYLVTLLSLTSGAYFPVDLLPGWLRWIGAVQPLTPALDLLRHLLVGTPLNDSITGELIRLVAFGVVLLPLSLLFLRWCIDLARKRDVLIEW